MRNSLYQTVFFVFSIALCGPLKGGKSEASKQSWRNYVCSLGLVHLVDREEMKQEWKRRIDNRKARRELLEQAGKRRARRSRWKSFSGTVTVATGSDGAATVAVDDDAQAKQESREPAGAGAVDQTDRQQLAELAFVNDPPEELLYENPYVGEATDDPLAWLDGVVAKAAAEVAQQLATNGKEE